MSLKSAKAGTLLTDGVLFYVVLKIEDGVPKHLLKVRGTEADMKDYLNDKSKQYNPDNPEFSHLVFSEKKKKYVKPMKRRSKNAYHIIGSSNDLMIYKPSNKASVR